MGGYVCPSNDTKEAVGLLGCLRWPAASETTLPE
jgi:hypothetical protein